MPIEQLSPELADIIDLDAEIKELGGGCGGSNGPAEGPLWWQEGNYLLFSDIHNDRRMKWSAAEGLTVFAEGVNRANGLTRDLQGRLLACEHDSRRVCRFSRDGQRATVLANSFQGRQLNRPNDVVVKSDGSIYFTDPWTFPRPANQWEQTFSGVYRLSPDLGTLTLLVSDFVLPNGLAFSPDESVLGIPSTGRHSESSPVSAIPEPENPPASPGFCCSPASAAPAGSACAATPHGWPRSDWSPVPCQSDAAPPAAKPDRPGKDPCSIFPPPASGPAIAAKWPHYAGLPQTAANAGHRLPPLLPSKSTASAGPARSAAPDKSTSRPER